MKVYILQAINDGHDPDAFLSAYSTQELADDAKRRLEAADKYGMKCRVDEVVLDADPEPGTY